MPTRLLPVKPAISMQYMKSIKRTVSALAAGCLLTVSVQAGQWVTYDGKEGPGKGKHIVLVSGDEEYRSEEALPMMLVMAQIYEEHVGDLTAALEVNQRIIELDDMNEQALEALERLYRNTEDWASLLDVFHKRIDLAADDDERINLYVQMAGLFEEQLAEPAQAIESYRAILDIDGENLDALQAIDRLYEAAEEWGELAEIINSQLLQADPDDTETVIQLKLRVGPGSNAASTAPAMTAAIR